MPLNDKDCTEILSMIREEVRKSGRADVDERLIRSLADRENAFATLRGYLLDLASEMALGGESIADGALARLQQFAKTESGEPIGGIAIIFTPQEADLYGRKEMEFPRDPEFDALSASLRELVQQIEHERERRGDRPDARY